MTTNEQMHSILDDISSASKGIEALKEKKEMQNEEWRNFFDRKLAQVMLIHSQLGYAFSNRPEWKPLERNKR